MAPTPEQQQIIDEERLAVLATVRRDGSPQLSPVSYLYRDGRFLMSTTRRSAKYHNIRRNPQVALCIIRPSGRPYVTVFGQADIEERGIEEETAVIFRRVSDRPLPEDFGDVLRRQRRILLKVTPGRFVP